MVECLLITIRIASVEGLAVHPAGIGAEIPRGELPAECSEARIELDAGLFEAFLQFFDEFVEILFHV